MGCWAIGGPWRFTNSEGEEIPAGWSTVTDDESIAAIHAALAAGATLFDTAANYGAGHSEELLGKALGKHRGDVVIATKFGYLVDSDSRTVRTDHSVVLGNLRGDCEASLRRLDTDYIDIYQLHVEDFPIDQAPEVVAALEELVADGKIRAYGWSTDNPEAAAAFAAGEHCTAVQFAYNIFSEKYGIRELLTSADLGGIARSPLAMGLLTGKMTPETTFPDDDVRSELDLSEGRPAFLLDLATEVRETLTAGGHSPAQGALAWILTSDARVVPIPGCKTPDQVRENLGALHLGPLTQDQMIHIEGIRASTIDTVRAYYNPAAAGKDEQA